MPLPNPQAVESAECCADYAQEDCSANLLSLYTWLAKHGAAGSLRRLHLAVSLHNCRSRLPVPA